MGDARRVASIDEDDTAEYDITEHGDLLHGIPDKFGMSPRHKSAQLSGVYTIFCNPIDRDPVQITLYLILLSNVSVHFFLLTISPQPE